MRLFTRIIFGLNCIYQIIVGAIFLFAPVFSITLYGFPQADTQSLAAHVGVRVMGVFLLAVGIISVLIAINPDKNPVLLPIMGAIAALTLVCWGITLYAREMTVNQVGLDVAVQVLLLIAVLGYAGKAGKTIEKRAAVHA